MQLAKLNKSWISLFWRLNLLRVPDKEKRYTNIIYYLAIWRYDQFQINVNSANSAVLAINLYSVKSL